MIPRASLEWETYRGQELVRYRDSAGFVHRVLTASYPEADHFFLVSLEKLKVEARFVKACREAEFIE
jgi:hypothetical protein